MEDTMCGLLMSGDCPCPSPSSFLMSTVEVLAVTKGEHILLGGENGFQSGENVFQSGENVFTG